MASVSCSLSEEQFLCSICLEVFSAPVTTPCGHSFCSTCINLHWDNSDSVSCPLCKRDLSTKPDLQVNTVLAEMVSQIKAKAEVGEEVEKVISEPQASAPGDVDCDLCPEPRLRALKSCLVCLSSFCQSHLQPHLNNPRLKRHQLIQALPNLEEHICPEHDRLLELFCRQHSHLICVDCLYKDHQSLDTVPVKKEFETHQAALKEQIKQRLLKMEEIQGSVKLSQKNADTEIQEGVRVFNTLMEIVQQSLETFKRSIEDKHKKKQEEAAELMEKIQTEISALQVRETEMVRLWSSGDHLKFVQSFTSTKAPELKDWTEETVRAPSYKGRVAQAVSELQRKLQPQIQQLYEAEIEKVQEFAVDVTLDPETAHRKLVLSKDLKQVHHSDLEIDLPENKNRFTLRKLYVFGKQNVSSGQFYFEVEVKGKTAWALGVAKESVDREGDVQIPPNGHWLIFKNIDEYQTLEDPPVILPITSPPEKVGVFVDYDEGLISFYDAGHKNLIHSFTDCCFTEKILPLLNPCNNLDGKNSAPLIFTPVVKSF